MCHLWQSMGLLVFSDSRTETWNDTCARYQRDTATSERWLVSNQLSNEMTQKLLINKHYEFRRGENIGRFGQYLKGTVQWYFRNQQGTVTFFDVPAGTNMIYSCNTRPPSRPVIHRRYKNSSEQKQLFVMYVRFLVSPSRLKDMTANDWY